MSKFKVLMCVLGVLLMVMSLGMIIVANTQQSAEELYEAAVFKKDADGDMEGAIKIFREIVERFANNKEIAAKAQLQIGICYEKLGQKNSKQAQEAFQKVIDNYPSQSEEVKIAREKLSLFLKVQSIAKKDDNEFKITKIWSGGRYDDFGTPSLDGSISSFVDWETGNLAVRNMKTGESKLITQEATWEDPTEYAYVSVISPDNKLVAYSWFNPSGTYELRLIGRDGSNKRILYSDKNFRIFPSSWNSDCTKIVADRYHVSAEYSQIVLINVSDGSVRILKTNEKGWLWAKYLSNDRYIACHFPVEGNPENYDISLLTADGSDEIPLVENPANDHLLGCVPGKNYILFLSDRMGTWDLWGITIEGGKVQGPPRSISRDIGDVTPLTITRDGVFYSSIFTRWFTTSIAPFDLATFKIREDLSKPLQGSNYNPVWSPDGDKLAYITEYIKPGPVYQRPLHVLNIQTGEDRELAVDYSIGHPKWSADGQFILFRGGDRTREQKKDYEGGIYKIDTHSGRVIPLIEFQPNKEFEHFDAVAAEFSYDESSLFYIKWGKLRVRNLKTEAEKILYENDFLMRELALSPDGEKLAFVVNDPSKEKKWILCCMPSSGGEARELCSFQGSDKIRDVSWTSDGKYLLFLERKDRGSSLRRISAEGGEPQVVWDANEKYVDFMSIHPSGKQIAFSTSVLEYEVYVMENFLPKDKEKE
jgi:Tol biopolymer transport system component